MSAHDSNDSSPVGAAVDLGFRTAYKVAHRMLRAYWSVRKPNTHGALVAVWHDGKIMIIKNSYRHHYTLPGGYVRSGESAAAAAQQHFDTFWSRVEDRAQQLV